MDPPTVLTTFIAFPSQIQIEAFYINKNVGYIVRILDFTPKNCITVGR